MSEVYEVIERETGKRVEVRSLYDSNGDYKPHNRMWQSMYYLRIPGTVDEIIIKPATQADNLRDIADRFQILADELRDEADKMDGQTNDE